METRGAAASAADPPEIKTMTDKPLPPPTEASIFEAGYLASTYRARRDFTRAQRAAIVSVLTGAAPDPRIAVPENPQPKLRSFALILARCESAATLLGWRKQITPEQKQPLEAAIIRLQEAAAQVAVRPSAHSVQVTRMHRVTSPVKPFAAWSPVGQAPYRPAKGSAGPRGTRVALI